MRDSDPADETWKFERRSALKLTAGLLATGTFVGSAAAGEGSAKTKKTVTTCRVKQGDRQKKIEPLSGDEPVEELYDYRLPGEYEGTGATSDEGPYYRSLGTESLQRNATTVMFLYDGPNGLSLVVVHDKIDGDGGGSVSWEVVSVPEDADWLVKDDYYTYADTGERASSNYDNWDTGGNDHAIDWTWMGGRTDGGVLGYLGEEFSLTVHPAYNEKAALYDQHYKGDMENWEMLSGDLDSPDRISLDLDAAVTVSCTTETKTGGDGKGENGDGKNGDGKNGDGKNGDGKNGDGKNGDGKKSEAEKRREEIAERQEEAEAEIEERRKELEEEIERKQEDIESKIETREAEIRAEAEENHEEIAERVEKGSDHDESKTGKETYTDVTERFESDVNWNASDDE